MSCYPCTHCNECGAFPLKLVSVCSRCGHEMPLGGGTCPACGNRSTLTIAKGPEEGSRPNAQEAR